MKVSIITVCLNSEKFLQDCISSIEEQTYPDIEYIVVDGGSEDRTREIILKNKGIVSKYKFEPDRGMYDAINKGLKMATGDIVGVLNSDDVFASPDSVSEIVACFELNQTDAVYGNLVYVCPDDINKITRYWKSRAFNRNHFRWGWMPAHPTFYIKRDLIKHFGLYENHFHTAADYEFMSRYLYYHRCSATHLDEIIIKMRRGGMSNGSLKRRLRANRRDYLAMKKNHIPFPLIISILKPLTKLHQYKASLLGEATSSLVGRAAVKFFKSGTRKVEHVESVQ